jgi:hypothetical protein
MSSGLRFMCSPRGPGSTRRGSVRLLTLHRMCVSCCSLNNLVTEPVDVSQHPSGLHLGSRTSTLPLDSLLSCRSCTESPTSLAAGSAETLTASAWPISTPHTPSPSLARSFAGSEILCLGGLPWYPVLLRTTSRPLTPCQLPPAGCHERTDTYTWDDPFDLEHPEAAASSMAHLELQIKSFYASVACIRCMPCN